MKTYIITPSTPEEEKQLKEAIKSIGLKAQVGAGKAATRASSSRGASSGSKSASAKSIAASGRVKTKQATSFRVAAPGAEYTARLAGKKAMLPRAVVSQEMEDKFIGKRILGAVKEGGEASREEVMRALNS